MEAIIKFDNISVIYDLGKSNEVRALDDISGQVNAQDYVVFFGP